MTPNFLLKSSAITYYYASHLRTQTNSFYRVPET